MAAAVVFQRARGIDPWRSGLGPVILLNLALPFVFPGLNISIGGHVGGLIGGAIAALAIERLGSLRRGDLTAVLACVAVGVWLVTAFLDGDWWVGIVLGLIAVVMATLGDLCESVIKRDLGIKDMSQVIPGHGGLMDRLDSLLATIAPVWLLLHYLVY